MDLGGGGGGQLSICQNYELPRSHVIDAYYCSFRMSNLVNGHVSCHFNLIVPVLSQLCVEFLKWPCRFKGSIPHRHDR